jgi:hypothetical protein
VQIPFDYYYRHQNRPVTKHGAPVDLFNRRILEPKIVESDLPELRELISDKQRVWLIYSHNGIRPEESDPDRPLTGSQTARSTPV